MGVKKYFTKAQIKDKLNLKEKDFEVADGVYHLIEMSGLQRIEAEERGEKAGTPGNPNNAIFRAKVFQLTVIDPETKARIFEDSDVEWLAEQSHNAVLEVVAEVLTMNGIGADALKSGDSGTNPPESGATNGAPATGEEPEAQLTPSA